MNQAALKAGEKCPRCEKEVRYPLSHICHPSDLRKLELRAAEQRERFAQDARFITTTNDWPRWPLLPVKRSSAQPDCGLMFSGDIDKGEIVVYAGLNLYGVPLTPGTYAQWFATAQEKIIYESVPALQAAGWRVD